MNITKGENETKECLARTPNTLHLHDDPMNYYTYTADNNESTEGESDNSAMDYIYTQEEEDEEDNFIMHLYEDI